MTYGVKSFNLAWGTVTAPVGAGAVSYRLFEDADGAGPAASTQIGGALTTSTYTHAIAGLLHTRLNAQYAVQACNAGGCSTLSGVITPNLTQSIGYGKASNSQANDWFGYSVALSGDGSTLAVGAPQEDSNAAGISGNQSDNSASNAGAVYVFTRVGSSWVQQAYLKASNPRAEDQFGYSLSLSGDGNTLAVGAPREDSGATGVGGNESDASASNAGAAYVFSRSAAAWTQQAYVKASNAQANDNFGYSVSLSGTGDTLAVGAPFEDSNATGIGGDQANNGANDSGAVYVFA
ncbi:MAG: integrin, partial [Haliea sp.]